jgi:AraC-like DNA-binding protein
VQTNDIVKTTSNDYFNISHNISDSWTMSNYHFHDSYELLFSLSDTTKFFVEDTMYDVKKNDLFIMNNMELHKTVAPANVIYDRYIIMFSPSYIDSYSTSTTNLLKCFIDKALPPNTNRLHLSEDQSHALLALLKKIEYYHTNNVYGCEIYKKITFTELLLLVNSFYYTRDNFLERGNITEFGKVQLILEYINQHLNECLSLDNLSGVFYLNKYYMSHIFKNSTGFSVNEYIVNRRILKSRELLKQNHSVSKVSEMVGFNNYCHFIRTFKKLVGMSPKQYAKKG